MINSVVIISSDYPNAISGIGDYSFLLAQHLHNLNVLARIITTDHETIKVHQDSLQIQWKLFNIWKILRRLKQWNARVIILQYPGVLYGQHSIIPHLYILILRLCGYKIITTLHEYSNVVFLRRVSEWIFIIFSHHIVVTSELEKNIIGNPLGLQRKISVIPIGPNVPKSNSPSHPPSNIIVTFGMFYPNKKVEDVIEFMKQMEARYPDKFVFRFVGGYHIHFMEYFERIKQKADRELHHTEWFINNPIDKVAALIREAFLAVQFYNDGVSLRRGTFLGIAINGVPIITNYGQATQELQQFVGKGLFYSNSEVDVFDYINRLINDLEYYKTCSENIKNNYANIGFDEIAREYKDLILRLNV